MITKNQCVNCAKSSFINKFNSSGEPCFGCKAPYCVFEPIADNNIQKITIEQYKNNKENK